MQEYSLRKHGTTPFRVAVIHGGPGAAGEMMPVAKELSTLYGVLEPFQTASTIDGQIAELCAIFVKNGELPLVLIGFSWGAWLCYMFAAKFPSMVKKLILIGCPPFEEKYVSSIMNKRMERLSQKEKEELVLLNEQLDNPHITDTSVLISTLGKIFTKCDSYDPLEDTYQTIEYRHDIYKSIWNEAKELRSSGKLIEFAKTIECPVLAIHGNYDPHPLNGVKEPGLNHLKKLKIISLDHCGHCPWIERQAKDQFYRILKEEILTS